ncbi:MAG: hypothetical protein V1866_03975 [archaeon]
MKIIKNYSLSEKTLEKDIDKFIRDAKKGACQYDYKYEQEGLKVIKAYFRMIEEEFKKKNFQVARICYKKLLFFLLQRDYEYFNYEDIMSKFNSEKIVGFYFTCLIKTCNINELFKEYLDYLKITEDSYFGSADKTILSELSSEDKLDFARLVEKESKNVKEKDYAMHDLIYFQLDLAKEEKDRKKYRQLCEKFIKIVGPEQKEEFDSAE